MIKTKIHIFVIAFIAGLILVVYAVYQNQVNNGTEVSTPASEARIDTGVETDTGKRLKIFSESGTQWGMNPFNSGKPLTENTGTTGTKEIRFQHPNTEWKSRDITLGDGRTLHYVFGEGNPIGATPLSEKEKESYEKCSLEESLMNVSCGPVDNEVFGYVNPDVEKDLLTLLSLPVWKSVLINCEVQFRINEYLDWGATYDKIMFGDFLNIENMLTIDPNTGRKELRFGHFGNLRAWFQNALRERKEIFGSDILKMNNCITQNGGIEIYRMMDIINQKPFYPSWKYPNRITDPQKYIPWY